MRVITLTPVISTGIYAAGDCVGELLTIPLKGPSSGTWGGIIYGVTLIDKDKLSVATDVVFFDQPAIATGGDNAPFSISDGQSGARIGHVSLLAADYMVEVAGGLNSVAFKAVQIPFVNGGGTPTPEVTVQLVTRGTPTYTTTSSLALRLFLREE